MKNIVNIILQAKGAEKVQDEIGGISKGFRRLNESCKSLTGSFFKAQIAVEGVIASLGGIKGIITSFTAAAKASENYRTRLVTLLGSVEEGNRLFSEMSKFASSVSFEYEEIMGSATDLAGVMKGGVDEIAKWMPMIADLAAASGLSIRETTSQIIRMYSAGAAAADMFRERGVLAMLGFQAGVSYSAEETRKRLIAAWEDPASKFRGASVRLASTWDGLMSMLADKWFQFRNAVMSSAPFEYIKSALDLLNRYLSENAKDVESLAKNIGTSLVSFVESTVLTVASIIDTIYPAMKMLWSIVKSVWQGFKDLPDWAKDVGIFGAMIGGRKGAIVIAGMVSLYNSLKTSVEGLQQAWKGNIKWSELATMNHEELTAKLKELREKGIIPVEEELADLADLDVEPEDLEGKFKLIFARIRANIKRLREESTQGLSGTGRPREAPPSEPFGPSKEEFEAYQKRLDEARRKRIEALQEIKQFSEEYHLFRLQQLEELAQKMRDAGLAEADIERWKAEEIRKLNDETWQFQVENATSMTEAIGAKLRLLANEARNTFTQVADTVGAVFERLKSTISDVLFDAMVGKLKSLKDYWRAFYQAVMRMLADIAAEALRTWAIQQTLKVAGGFHEGGLVMHSGGLVPVFHAGGLVGGLPRFHSGGLAADERVAILQTRERVLSREQNRMFEDMYARVMKGAQESRPPVIVNMTVQAMDADSFNSKILEARDAVAAAVMAATSDNHPVRRAR